MTKSCTAPAPADNDAFLLPLASDSIEPVDLLSWLESRKEGSTYYWRSRDGQVEAAGWGDAFEIVANESEKVSLALEQLDHLLTKHPQRHLLCLFGGGRFNFREGSDDIWRSFPALRFVQPKVTLLRREDEYSLIYSTGEDKPEESREELLKHIRRTEAKEPTTLPSILSRADHPELPGWEVMMERALQRFRDNYFEKVVLARRTDLVLSETLSPFTFVRLIKKAKQECYSFIISPEQGEAFVSASPERLFRWVDSTLQSDALGSTIQRSRDAEEDAQLCRTLLEDSKSAAEHRFISEDISEKFERLSTNVDCSGTPRIVTLADVHHLLTPVSGTVREGITRGDVLLTLHPSPAVGGTPTDRALDFIDLEEPFKRGWYAGPVGLVTTDYTEFCVALRSLIIAERKVHLFTGAGIVEQSDPRLELEEIENKMSTALKLFGSFEKFKRSYV